MLDKRNPFNSQVFHFRLNILNFFVILLFIFLLANVFIITIFKGNENFEKSENNFLRRRHIEPPRGIIFDRNKKPLALNRYTYSVQLTKYKIPLNILLKSIKEVSHILNKDINVSLSQIKSKPRWEAITLLKGLKFDEVLLIYERIHQLSGISVEENYERFYPYKESLAFVLGFMGAINQRETEEYLQKGYSRNSYIGRTGVEYQYEKILRGAKGEDIIINDAKGRKIEVYDSIQPIPGENIELTLDIDMQNIAMSGLSSFKGAAVALNPQNGEIYVMASNPSFDPNNLKQGGYFLNKAIREYYAPGSTFKPITSLAGLEYGMHSDENIFCDSYFYLKGRKDPFRCDFKAGHGFLDLKQALKYSCNIYFYTIANRVGADALINKASLFGFGNKTGIDLPGERMGFLPPIDKNSLFRGEVVMLGIGQGRLSVTPIQVLRFYSALANGGYLIKPHLFFNAEINNYTSEEKRIFVNNINTNYSEKEKLFINKEFLDVVRDGLFMVVNEKGGTGFKVGFKSEWRVAGKTGTAQNWRGKEPDAWFACWAPFENPQIAVAVVLENVGHGAEFAAPIARDIIAKYFEKVEQKNFIN